MGIVAEQLVPFTGYYTLDTGGGNFLLIDTNLGYLNSDGVVTTTYLATVTIWMDEEASSVYDESCCTFDNGNLIITYNDTQIANVDLYKDYSNGNSSALRGIINGTQVTGVTPFGPIQLPVFAAEYFEPVGGGTFEGRLVINSDLSVWYREGFGDFVQINEYLYNYAMFVVGFILNGQTYEFEMGTTKGSGRVAGNSASAGLLVSITASNTYQCFSGPASTASSSSAAGPS